MSAVATCAPRPTSAAVCIAVDAYLARQSRLIDGALDRLLPKASAPPRAIHRAMRYSLFAGGKRLRPALCLAGCELAGGAIARALPAACALECIHTYSLIHDDLPAMDDAATRRGRPALHKAFDEGLAILAGDALLTVAFELLATGPAAPAARLAVLRDISVAIGTTGLIGGQVMDLALLERNGRARPAPTAPLLRDVARRKTGALITASVCAGARLGGATAAQYRRVAAYGRAIGLAFQIVDDVMDRDGLAAVRGVEAARAEARALAEEAKRQLRDFGARGHMLRSLAEFVVTRSN